MVLRVGSEVVGEIVDALRQEGDLDAGGAGVSLTHSEPLDDLALFGRAETHLRLVVDVHDDADLPRIGDTAGKIAPIEPLDHPGRRISRASESLLGRPPVPFELRGQLLRALEAR